MIPIEIIDSIFWYLPSKEFFTITFELKRTFILFKRIQIDNSLLVHIINSNYIYLINEYIESISTLDIQFYISQLQNIIENAIKCGSIAVLDLLKESDYNLLCHIQMIGNITALQWCLDHRKETWLKIIFTRKFLESAIYYRNMNILYWLKQNISYSQHDIPIDAIKTSYDTDNNITKVSTSTILTWLKQNFYIRNENSNNIDIIFRSLLTDIEVFDLTYRSKLIDSMLLVFYYY